MEQNKTIGIIGAMASEVEILKEKLLNEKTTEAAGVTFYEGTLEGKPVVIAQCGIGKVYAAICTQAMIDRFQVGCVINTGVAGGLHHSLAIGDIVISTDAVQHDFDLTALAKKLQVMLTESLLKSALMKMQRQPPSLERPYP